MLKDADSTWIDNQEDIASMILTHFKAIYSPTTLSNSPTSLPRGEEIDLVLRELHLPQLILA